MFIFQHYIINCLRKGLWSSEFRLRITKSAVWNAHFSLLAMKISQAFKMLINITPISSSSLVIVILSLICSTVPLRCIQQISIKSWYYHVTILSHTTLLASRSLSFWIINFIMGYKISYIVISPLYGFL